MLKKNPINSLQNLHISQTRSSSPHIPSMHNMFPSLAFHKKRLLWKLKDYMNVQWGRQRADDNSSYVIRSMFFSLF